MFIQHLTNEQQGILYSFSKRLVTVDGVIDSKEETILETIRAQCSESADFGLDINLVEIDKIFHQQHQKIAFMIELIGVAHADDTYTHEEKDFVLSLAENLSIDPELLKQMESWVERQLGLVKEANLFMEM